MVAKFELSAYGVEEMNKQEMIEIDGGVAPLAIWLIKTIVTAAVGGIVTCILQRAFYHEDTGNINSTKDHNEEIVKIYDLNIIISPNGQKYIHMDSVIMRN